MPCVVSGCGGVGARRGVCVCVCARCCQISAIFSANLLWPPTTAPDPFLTLLLARVPYRRPTYTAAGLLPPCLTDRLTLRFSFVSPSNPGCPPFPASTPDSILQTPPRTPKGNMALVSVRRRLFVALAVCLVGTNKYGLVGATTGLTCKQKCKLRGTSAQGNEPASPGFWDEDEAACCSRGCDLMGTSPTKTACGSSCGAVSTALDAPSVARGDRCPANLHRIRSEYRSRTV